MKIFSEFPAGAAGAGLLLLRLAAALLLALAMIHLGAPITPADLVMSLSGVTLILGLCARIVGVACAAAAGVVAIAAGGEIGALIGLQAISAAAIALLGPGAYSLDARLFGRRVIDLR